MEIVLWIVGVLFAFPYVVGPVLLWLNGTRIPVTNMEDADQATLPSAAGSHFWKTTQFFTSSGFEKLGVQVRELANNGFSGYKQLWRHPATGETALVGAFLKDGDESFCNTFTAFMHERANGTLITTSNFNGGARTLLEPAGGSKVTVPTQDLAELRSLHMSHVALLRGESVRPLRVRDGFALCKQLDTATRTVALSTKRFRKERDGETLRITPWGAVYGIWINLAPLKWTYASEERQLLERVRAVRMIDGAMNASRAA